MSHFCFIQDQAILQNNMSTSSRPSFFSRISSRPSSIRSQASESATSSSSSSFPKGCREFKRSRYAKDGKGFDFNMTYPYSTASAASSESRLETPVGARDFKLRYAKDSKGHDFTSSYSYSVEDYQTMVDTADLVPKGCRDSNNTMRYAKDGKGIDFTKTYRFSKN